MSMLHFLSERKQGNGDYELEFLYFLLSPGRLGRQWKIGFSYRKSSLRQEALQLINKRSCGSDHTVYTD